MVVPLNMPPVVDEDADPKAAVLIVDDLPEKLLVFRTVLEELNQELVFVRSGGEALREVLHREFAVILLDVNMPDIDGFETASLIRKYRRSAHTPIIFVTAYADEMQTALGYSLGAVDYILSPVVPEVLRGKVKVFIDLYNMQRRVQRQSEQKAALAAAEAARRTAEEKTRRSQFLSQASRLLGGSLDIGIGTRRLLELAVPQLASLATLVVQGESLAASQALCFEALPGGGVQTTEIDFGALPQPVQDVLAQAIETRRRVDLHDADLQALRADPVRLPFSVGSVLPLVTGERALGAMMVVSEEEGRDWSVLEELADRAAMAFENARLYRSLEAEIAERRQAQDKLQQLNQRKDEFLAMLSHELRNPLAPIRNSVEVIRRLAPADPKLVRANEVMERQVHQMTRLVDELLDVARISQGKIGLQIEPVDLVAVIAHAVETVRPVLDARHHHLTQQLPDGAVWMRGDFARLSQVVANLLNNAAKYTEEGGQIQLSLGVEGGHALITVRDNGIGIDAELLPNVFDLFEQGKRALDRAQGGLGVGLTLVRRLVELHNGHIEVSSAGPGQGAEFSVRLPCLASVAPAETVPRPAPAPAPVSAGCRVLVVDDNIDAAESVAMFLGMVGHEVKAVPDGVQALACAPTYAPHVVVLDIGLPMLDGYEVAKRLRALPQTAHALLVAVTGYGSKHDRARADEVGFDRYLVKPADPCVLADMIASWRESAEALPPGRSQGEALPLGGTGASRRRGP
jgi:signal transduction histidine kinase/DNA-binding response OmpR family regulator